MTTNLSLLKYVARQFKYRELPELIGKQVMIQSVDTIMSDLQLLLENTLFHNSELLAPERKFIEGAMAKYGIVDLTISTSGDFFDENTSSGIPLLKALHFIPEKESRKKIQELIEEDDDLFSKDDPMCIQELKEDIAENRLVGRLFLETDRPKGLRLVLPPDYFPRTFVVKDAAVTNAGFCWFHKHFYF